MPEYINIYTDGASRGNPGRGGYGVIWMYKKHYRQEAQAYRKTTNNRMELMAVIRGLEELKTPDIPVRVYTDSKYVSDAVNKNWLSKWQTKSFAKVKNPDLWKSLIPLLKEYQVEFIWVKGHADNVYNNRCDELATVAADHGPYEVDQEYERSSESLF